jgi:hypothetical protein
MKAVGIPNNREHQFFQLNNITLPFWNVVAGLEPDHFMIWGQAKPGLVEGDDIMPGSDLLHL